MSDRGVRIAVTGATGLVGGRLVESLSKAGNQLVAVARDATKAERTVGTVTGVSLKIADVRNQKDLEEAFAGCDVVIHAAGSVDPYGEREEIFAINVGGTKAALVAARQAGARQFIHISSLSVITGQGDQYDVDESAPLRECGENYADSKVEAERLVIEECRQGEMAATALRPGFIYGPGERAWMPRLIDSISRGKAMLVDGGVKQTNVIYVENLARACQGAILNEAAYGQVYNLTDGETVSKKDLFDAIADCLDLPRVRRVVPGAAARLVCEVVSFIAPHLSREKQKDLGRFSRAAFRLAGVNQGFSIAKAERELNYVDRVPFASGMKETLESFKRDRVATM